MVYKDYILLIAQYARKESEDFIDISKSCVCDECLRSKAFNLSVKSLALNVRSILMQMPRTLN